MADTSVKSKWVFWSMILAAFLFTAVPSLVLMDKAQGYWRFLTGWNPAALKQTRTSFVPHPEEPDVVKANLHFVEFSLKAPAAEAVSLVGSFNRWDPSSHPMDGDGKGLWEIVLPLPPGTYHYGFEVDGKWRADPSVKETETKAGREASVRKVP